MVCTETADVVVVGAGMAGLVAATELVDACRDVVVLEKADRPGGAMRISNGIVWTYLPYENLRSVAPDGNPALQQVLAERFEDDLAWLDDTGASLAQPTFEIDGTGKEIDPQSFTDHMVGLVEDGGGEIKLETPLSRLVTEDGEVTGVRATTEDGSTLVVETDAVVVATGGFQGNERLLEQYVTDDTANIYLRATPYCTGDGFLAAERAGAKTTGGLGDFYGHSLVAPPAEFSMDEFADATQYYGYKAVALDRHGERFTDESESSFEVALAQDVVRRADGRAYYVFDDQIADETFGYHTAAEIRQTAEDLGGRAATVETLHALETTLSEWGINGERAVETLRTYNQEIRADRNPDPPREAERYPLDDPPFRVVEVQPAITFTMGGLSVTTEMAVKRQSASASGLAHDPIETVDGVISGLYTAGNDVGNVHRRRYVGGLALALVSGRVAAESVREQWA